MGAEGKFDLKLAPSFDPESPNNKPVSCAHVSGPSPSASCPTTTASCPQQWSSLVKNNCPDKSSSSAALVGGTSSQSRKGSSSSVCSVASSSDLSSAALGLLPGNVGGLRLEARRNEGLVLDQNSLSGGVSGCDGQQQEPIVVLSSAVEASSSSTNADSGTTNSDAAISMGLVSVSSPDVSSVSEVSSKDAPTPRPLCSAANARLSVSSLLAAGAPMSSSASVPNLSSREASLMESFVRRAPNMSRTNATNNMNLSRSSSDNNTNTLGRNVMSSASKSLLFFVAFDGILGYIKMSCHHIFGETLELLLHWVFICFSSV